VKNLKKISVIIKIGVEYLGECGEVSGIEPRVSHMLKNTCSTSCCTIQPLIIQIELPLTKL
jgi:hypothetical protein